MSFPTGVLPLGDLAAFIAVLARASALVYTAPILGDRSTPGVVKAVVAAAIAMCGAAVRGPIDPDTLLVVIPVELAFGLVAGLSARLILMGADVGGQIIGIQMGIGIAGQLDPATGDDALPTRAIVGALAGLAFLAAGGLAAVVRLACAPGPVETTLIGAALELPMRAGEVLLLASRVAAPLIVAGMASSMALALASRSAPQVNLFSLDMALRSLVALLVLAVCAPALIAEVAGAGQRAVDVLGALTP